jgi:uncharacterized protein
VVPQSLKPGLGNWVDGDRFFNRENELKLLAAMLLEGDSVSLVAQRRIGKTSLMREVARRLALHIVPLQVDLEKAERPEDAVVELSLAAQVHEGAGRRAISAIVDAMDGMVGRIESIKASVLSVTLRSKLDEENWLMRGDSIFRILHDVADQQGKPVVVFFDEVPILVNRLLRIGGAVITPEGRAIADRFMSWLRDNVIRHKGKVGQVVTGSIGLEPILAQAGLNGTMNAYRSFELRPWKTLTAVQCVVALADHRRFPLAEAQARRMIELLGCPIPHHVQMFFDHVYSAYVIDEIDGPVTDALIDKVYNTSMTGLRGHPELSHMEERLRLVMSPCRFTKALAILTEAATVGVISGQTALEVCGRDPCEPGFTKERELADILALLVHDGYLRESGNLFEFESALLRNWWKRRFGQGYAPVGVAGALS